MQKILISLCFVLSFVTLSYGEILGNVKDDNNGNKGYILINTGELNGKQNDIGTWLDPEDWIKDYNDILKGDKGLDGLNGLDGHTPIKGVDYFDGVDGKNGLDGKDIDSITVDRLDNQDNILQDNINTETKQRKDTDKIEKKARIIGDKKLQNNIDNEKINRELADALAQEDIAKEQFDRIKLGNELQNNINNETVIRKNADNQLQTNINNVNSRVDDVDKKLNSLAETQINIDAELQFIREKNLTVGLYNKFDVKHCRVPEVGVRVVIGIGKSWTEREIDKLKLENLKRQDEELNIKSRIAELEAKVNYFNK